MSPTYNIPQHVMLDCWHMYIFCEGENPLNMEQKQMYKYYIQRYYMRTYLIPEYAVYYLLILTYSTMYIVEVVFGLF